MRFFPVLVLLAAAAALSAASEYAPKYGVRRNITSTEGARKREGKVFSLFSIVSFINSICFTTSSLSRGTAPSREGTCFTQSECVSLGGRAAGVCASGFGVCCLFTTDECGATIRQNNTYVRNPGFPDEYEELDDCSYNVQKISSDICSLRLDFESFSLAGPSTGTDTELEFLLAHEFQGGLCDQDIFTVSASGGQNIPLICGSNDGEHIYVDVGSESATAVLQFDFPNGDNVNNVDREWEVRVAQIPCGANFRPPAGCLQYFTGISGTIKTFNFDTTDSSHLGNQQYSACVRREAGFCCVEYTPCADETDPFTLGTEDIDVDANLALQEELCTLDFILIEGGSSTCQTSPGVSTVNRYCGTLLSTAVDGDLASDLVCDCTAPFAVDIFTDALADNGDPEDPENTRFSRGVCLDYSQVPC